MVFSDTCPTCAEKNICYHRKRTNNLAITVSSFTIIHQLAYRDPISANLITHKKNKMLLLSPQLKKKSSSKQEQWTSVLLRENMKIPLFLQHKKINEGKGKVLFRKTNAREESVDIFTIPTSPILKHGDLKSSRHISSPSAELDALLSVGSHQSVCVPRCVYLAATCARVWVYVQSVLTCTLCFRAPDTCSVFG